jgi:hypothetical protein
MPEGVKRYSRLQERKAYDPATVRPVSSENREQRTENREQGTENREQGKESGEQNPGRVSSVHTPGKFGQTQSKFRRKLTHDFAMES